MIDYKTSIQEQFGQNEHSKILMEQYLDEIIPQQKNLRTNSLDNEEDKKRFKNTKNKRDINTNDIIKNLQNSGDILRPRRNFYQRATNIGQNYESLQNSENILRSNKKLVQKITNIDQNYESHPNAEDVLHPSKIFVRNVTNTGQVKGRKKCWYLEKFKQKLLLGKVVRRECSRRSNFDGKFLTIMTNVLNEYADTMFKFTEEMTEILLDNIFGQNTDLRNNILDVNKLLKYLRKSVNLHKSHSHVITLTSRQCLTSSVPGCFCKSGFVESSGQCVLPADCITNEHYVKYLKRIIIA